MFSIRIQLINYVVLNHLPIKQSGDVKVSSSCISSFSPLILVEIKINLNVWETCWQPCWHYTVRGIINNEWVPMALYVAVS